MRNAARTPLAAHLRSRLDVRLRRRAHEHEVGLALRQVVDVGHGVDAEHRRAFEVGGEDVALVAGGEEVVQRDEPELAGVRRRAGDDDALRIEERAEVPLVAAHDAHLDQRVDGHGHAVDDDQRIHVGARDLGMRDRGVGQADEHVDQLAAVDRRLAAERAEQPLRGEVVDHVLGVRGA